jgi:methionyl-tRNA formyltransferase
MTNTSKTLLFFGNERLVSGLAKTDTPILRGLLENGYNIAAIISHYSETKSRSNRQLEVAEIGKAHNIPVLLPNRPTDIIDQIAAYHADAAILVAYGRIIPQRIIDLFPQGIINVHPSLLPKYRGPTPIESAIAAGDSSTGVSIMKLTAGMDTGPVYGSTEIRLRGNETKFDVYDHLAHEGEKLLLELLPDILNDTLQPTPQDDSQATYSHLLSKDDAWLDLPTLTAEQAERLIRAHLEFPKSKVLVLNHEIIITKAHVSKTQKTPLDLLCRDGTYLSIDELIAPSGRHMNSEAFLRGYAAKS